MCCEPAAGPRPFCLTRLASARSIVPICERVTLFAEGAGGLAMAITRTSDAVRPWTRSSVMSAAGYRTAMGCLDTVILPCGCGLRCSSEQRGGPLFPYSLRHPALGVRSHPRRNTFNQAVLMVILYRPGRGDWFSTLIRKVDRRIRCWAILKQLAVGLRTGQATTASLSPGC